MSADDMEWDGHTGRRNSPSYQTAPSLFEEKVKTSDQTFITLKSRKIHFSRAVPPMLSVLPFYIHCWSFLVFGHSRHFLAPFKRTLFWVIRGARLSDNNKASHPLSIAWMKLWPQPAVRPKNCEFQETEMVSTLLDTYSSKYVNMLCITGALEVTRRHNSAQLMQLNATPTTQRNSHNSIQLTQLVCNLRNLHPRPRYIGRLTSCQGKKGGGGVEEQTGPGHKYSLNPLLHSPLNNVKCGAVGELCAIWKSKIVTSHQSLLFDTLGYP